ncbi:hypothetical protein [Aquimarina pacifica]|uniref:hypothetical protein n=1 Tax=Aquimarina pacifica TaxID=1296415 RepID=UPI0004717339|nr:hypothetical protein [Aquimarina pacifica]
MKHQIFKKLFILSIFIFSSNISRAELIFDFCLQSFDSSQYPIIKIKGGILQFGCEDALAERITFFENGKKVKIDVDLKKLQKVFQIITLTYKTTLPKEVLRKFYLNYNSNHNFFFKYDPIKYKHIKQIGEFGEEKEEYEDLFNYTKTLLSNYESTRIEKMYVLALNGLLVREQPNTLSKVIGKLDFGTITNASIQQYGKEIIVPDNKNLKLEIEGKFRKINYKEKEAYVFDGFLTTFTFFKSLENQNFCSIINNSQVQEENNQDYRKELGSDKYGNFLLLKYTSIEKVYLIIQALSEDFKNLEIKEQQNYGEIYDGWPYYIFNHDNYIFKLLKYDGYPNIYTNHKVYFECYE